MDFFAFAHSIVQAITDIVLSLAGSPWIYLLVFLLCMIDGFFPPLPSETVVVAVSAVAVSAGQPALWGIVVVTALGAVAGDNIAYTLGRGVGRHRFGWMRRPRVAKVFDRVEKELAQRPTSLILTGRYIPIGRIAVNTMAGVTRMPRLPFFALTVVAGITWALYSVGIGLLAGAWARDHPLLAVVVAIVIALVLGLLIDRILSLISRRRQRRKAALSSTNAAAHDPEAEPGAESP